MIEHCLRLKRGSDLKEAIETYCRNEGIDAAVVLSSVGCVSRYHLRLAKALDCIEKAEAMEILTLNGTIACGKAHLHIALADENGHCVGGHLQSGTIIDTTCELVLGVIEDYCFKREYDQSTGYDEIVFVKRDF